MRNIHEQAPGNYVRGVELVSALQAQIDCLTGVADGLEIATQYAPADLVPGMKVAIKVMRGAVETIELERAYDR